MNETKQKLTALFKRGWLNDEEINTLEHMDIGVKVYPIDDELENWIVGDTEDGHMPLVRKPQHVIDEDRGDEIRQSRKEQAQREMYDDPVMNWSGLR